MKQTDIFERIICSVIDATREELAKNDDEYLSMEEERARLEILYLQMDQNNVDINLVNKYIDVSQKTNMRFADISYMAGVRDTISLMYRLGFLKEGVANEV